jgi:D-beta-D-heptose 7-phosphate kinase/D-beta-D-heptose 1-phosphate adenosyltransferase
MKAIRYLDEKKKNSSELIQWRERWKFASRKIVFTNGVFDIVHAGHIHSLKHAASFGDILVVGLNSDASVKRIKGEERPIQCVEDRIIVLCWLSFNARV